MPSEINQTNAVDAQHLKKLLVLMLEANEVPMIYGPPGIGKTKIVEELAEELGYEIIKMPLIYMDQTDLRGIPDLDKTSSTTEWKPPKILPFKQNGIYKDDKKIILLIDELPQANPSLQNSVSSLLYGGKIGEFQVTDGTRIICIGNRDEDRAATYKMPTHVGNRVCHITLLFEFGCWLTWAQENGIHPAVMAYGKYRPNNINNFNPDSRINATPRIWEKISKILRISPKIEKHVEAVIAGFVGDGVAKEFIAFNQLFLFIDRF